MRVVVTLFVAWMLAGCSAPPSHRDIAPVADVKRVTAIDMGLQSTARRLANLSLRLRSVPEELLRVGKMTKHGDLLDSPARHLASLSENALAIGGKDLRRIPHLPAGMLPTPDAYARRIAEGFATTLELFGGAHHALGEIDDRRHRTSPDDDHPEASWWDRIRRRLRL